MLSRNSTYHRGFFHRSPPPPLNHQQDHVFSFFSTTPPPPTPISLNPKQNFKLRNLKNGNLTVPCVQATPEA
ncbi:hypothetical protein OIU79_021920, partial [Salix purpurea]